MPDVAVNLPEISYVVHVELGLINRAGSFLRSLCTAVRTIIVTDEIVGPIHLPPLLQSLRAAGIEPIVAELHPGERNKTLQSLLPVFDSILSSRIERTTPLVALGGGIVGDMAGFAAATVLRGIPLIQIPTTLLAMVDSSVGGKTGVNHAMGKNLIGAFHHPITVLADPQLLTTLPRSEFVNGLAECIKHEVIRDAEGFYKLETMMDAVVSLDLGVLTELVAHNVRIKARVVEADPLENSERAHLNFGHTFGHAIERASDHRYSHGQAVALGMVAAASVAVDMGLLRPTERDRVVALIARAGLPIADAKVDADEVISAMFFDKKVQSSRLRLILPDRIGHVVIRDDLPSEIVNAAVQRIVAR